MINKSRKDFKQTANLSIDSIKVFISCCILSSMMPEISICGHRQEKNTRDFVIGILSQEFSLPEAERPDLKDIPGTYQTGDGQFWIAVNKGNIVGTLALQDYGRGWLRMRRFMIAKEWRSKGLAQEMLAVCIEHAISRDAEAIYLSTVEELARANRFYDKMGFKRIDKPDWFPATEDRIFWRLNLEERDKNHASH
jgi:putative acetyltransferase